ncbi:MAG TPA: DUF885 family protein [Bryobacteraceae bacterium]|nr:DUF885 family protein [Bryobacteraceae bacterium]
MKGPLPGLLLLTLAGIPIVRAFQAPQADFDNSTSEMRALIERFAADRAILNRAYSDPLAAGRQSRLKDFLTEWQTRLRAMNFDSMSQDGKVDYVLLRNRLDHDLRQLELDVKAQAEAAAYTGFAPTIFTLEEKRRKLEPMNPREAASALTTLAKQVGEARRAAESQLREQASSLPPNRRVIARRGADEIASLRNTLRSWFTFYDGYDPVFTWWAEEAYRSADSALQDYRAFLREKVVGLPPETAAATAGSGGRGGNRAAIAAARAGDSADIIGDPIGRDGLLNELANEMIPYTPEELIAIAQKELAWCENEMKRAAREMGFGDDWKSALEKVKNMYVDPGKQPEAMRDLAVEAVQFLDEHDLVTIPPMVRETWRMEMMTPERQLVNPFFTGGEVLSVSYPTNTMTFEQKMMSMRGNNIPFSRATVFHELIPGHHLQGYMAARYRPYRAAVGGTPFITEGWSLYWELLLWDLKFQKTPADRVGALFWRMHRCARIIFSLSFHLGKMTPQEAIDFLVDRIGHERENAIAEVRRSFEDNYSPLYQAAYLLGGMQLYALHKELVGSGKMTNRQFHDAVLKENRIPVEMIRAGLIKQPLTRDYKSTWRFYGEP